MAVTPMFPLGTVLVPGMVLPLHVFEPRYRQMLDDCLAGDRTFGVVLIERGSEVGGGDVRTDVGSLARIAQAEELTDGRWTLLALGVRRIRVDRWLPDDPYPRAEVSDWPDTPDRPPIDHGPEAAAGAGDHGDYGEAPGSTGEAASGHGETAGPAAGGGTGDRGAGEGGAVPVTVLPLLRRAAALARELGMVAAPLDLELSDDPVTAGYQAITAAPLGPADRQRLLAAPSLTDRWALLDTLLADQIQLLEAQLAHGGD